jgi:hypothetical protein
MKISDLSALTLLALLAGTGAAAPTARDSAGNPPLRGSEDLLGYSASNKLSPHSTEDIKYTLASGQKDDADLGVYLDFETVDNPQPIRGELGGTDPGPRKSLGILCDVSVLTMQETMPMIGSTATSWLRRARIPVRLSMRSGQWVS